MADIQQENFPFVLQNPKKKFSRETQTLIRKRAMLAVGEAVRKSNRTLYERHSNTPKDKTEMEWKSPVQNPQSTEIPVPLKTGLESIAMDSGLHILDLDLSALTCVHVGSYAATVLSSQPDRLRGVLSCRQKSYFSYILPRFGHTPVLDDAFRCLVAAAQCMLVPSSAGCRDVVFGYYGRALRSLQGAVEDVERRFDTEVLCATAVLAMFEILSSPDGKLWSQHIAGAARLIELRGPERFTTDFDKMLLVSLSYPICTQAMLNNEPCFLETPIWRDLILRSATPGDIFSDQSTLALEMMTIKYRVPALVKRTNHAVATQESLNASTLNTLITDLQNLRTSIITWRRTFNTALITADDRPRNETEDFAKRYELLGICLIINIMVSRMLVAVKANGRVYLEEEVQSCAHEMKGLQGAAQTNERAAFFLTLKGAFADAAIGTHECFYEVSNSVGIVDLWRLERFFEMIGRKCCDGETCCEDCL